MELDVNVLEVLAKTRVLELTTLTKTGGLNTRPMSGMWLPDRGQIVLTTPVAYPHKVLNIRRDGRVALLYSDFTGSGLSEVPAVLVQGMATAPEIVAPPQDLEDYWRGLFRKNPAGATKTTDPHYRTAMDWYYWRLPIFVTPLRVNVLEVSTTGGAWEPPAPDGAPMKERITDAVARYPTAVFAARDQHGHPCSTRTRVSWATADTLRLIPSQPFGGTPGPANLLWHRHNGRSGDMTALLVAGKAAEVAGEWTFSPERMPGLSPSGRHQPSSYEEWIQDGRSRSEAYLAKRGIAPPEIDWEKLADFGTA
jgi:general stress protein 26